MFKTMKKRIKNEKGLTLIELLAVVVILAIVAAIAIPAIGNIIDNSRMKAMKSDVANVINATNIYKTEAGSLPTSDYKTALEPYIENWGSVNTITGIGTDSTTGEITVSGTATVNKKSYTLTSVKLSTLKVDDATLTDTGIGETPATP